MLNKEKKKFDKLLVNGLTRTERRKVKTKIDKMWGTFSQIESRDPKFAEQLLYIFITQVELGYYNVSSADTGVGKTFNIIRKFMKAMIEQKDITELFYVAPERIATGETINDHVRDLTINLAKSGKYLRVMRDPSISQVQTAYATRGEDDILFFIMTDALFNNRVDVIKECILNYKREGKSFFSFDECHISASSTPEMVEINNGLGGDSSKCIKFSNIEKIIDISYVYGVSATLVKEQTENIGSDRYKEIDFKILKEQLTLMVSGHLPTLWFDKEDDLEVTLIKYFNLVISAQSVIDACKIPYKLTDELIPKITGMIALEQKHPKGESIKDDKHLFIDLMNTITVPRYFDFDLALDTSKELRVWRFKDGNITELDESEKTSNGYVSSDGLVVKMKDSKSKLKFMVLVGKGASAMDIPNLNYVLSVRSMTNEYEGEPVITRGVQILGRCRRLVIPFEKIVKHWEENFPHEIGDCIRYYILVNQYQAMLPDTKYWRAVDKRTSNKLPSVSDIKTHFYNKI